MGVSEKVLVLARIRASSLILVCLQVLCTCIWNPTQPVSIRLHLRQLVSIMPVNL